MVGVGLLCGALSAPGQSFGLAFYLGPLMGETGLTRVEISGLYSGATLAAAVMLPVVGRLADRWAGGAFLGMVLGAMAGAMLLLAASTGVVVLAVALLLLRMLGQGAVGLGTLTLTVRWFERRRARALAIVALGYALGEMVFPGIIVGLMDWAGWRGSLVVLACAYALVFAPFVMRFGRDPQPGERLAETMEVRTPVAEAVGGRRPASRSLRQAMRTPVFWALTAAVSIPPLVMTGVFLHHVALLGAFGWVAGDVARAMVVVALGGVAGTWAGGVALERLPERFGVSGALALLGFGLATLLLFPPTMWTLHAYGLLLGLSAGVHKVAGSLVWPTYYGIDSVGAITGTVSTLRNAASAAGPPLAAALAGPESAFDRVLLVFALTCAAGAVATLALRPPVPLPLGDAQQKARDVG